jgi:DNA-binding GntR family transcriptional regulator
MSNASPLLSSSLPSAIARQLEQEIISGSYAPGQRLIERDLATRFEVSAIPVREALQALENRGLVRRRPHYGCSVIDLTLEEIERFGELRALLEPQVIRWAAERIDPGARRELELQLKKLYAAAKARNYADFFFEDLELHRLIWEQAKNPFAASALGTTIGSLFVCGLRDARGINLKAEYAKHVGLVAAILAGQPAKAANILTEIAEAFQEHVRMRPCRGASKAAKNHRPAP